MCKANEMATIQNVLASTIIANLLKTQNDIGFNIANLSGGVKTNASIADFTIGTLLKNQASSLTTANLNASQGKSLLNTADATLDQIIELLQDQKDLAVRASDASLTDNERANLNSEFAAITEEINRLATTTKFNSKYLLDGSLSDTAKLTTLTGQSVENYTLLTDSDYSLSGTTASGELKTSSVFDIVESDEIGATAGYATLSFAGAVGGAVTNAEISIGGVSITFGSGQSTAATVATAFVAAAEASTSNIVRQFVFTDNGDGTVTVTGADLGTAADATTFSLTNRGTNLTANTVTFGGSNIDTVGAGTARSIATSASGVDGTLRTITDDLTFDANLEGAFSNFTATLSTSGTQNTVTFTVDVNGTTYTSQEVTLFGTGGFNSKGNTIKNGQVITFYNTAGPTDSGDEYTDNGFSLTVGATDITIAGGTQDAFETDLTNTAAGFLTQLDENRINQSRSLIFDLTNPTGGDFTISAATGTVLEGIEGFDAIGANNKGDINFVGDIFGSDGTAGDIGKFSFDITTHELTVTIDGEVYTADLSDSTANTGGIVNGAGSYNTATNTITIGAGTTIVLHSANTTDGRQIRIDLSNVDDTSLVLNTQTLADSFSEALDSIFGSANNNSLNFQVGESASNKINVSIGSATTTSLYLNDAGTYTALDISTEDGASAASDILDNAINNALSLQADINSVITSFNSAITANAVAIQNSSAASSSLLNTDYALESTLYAQNVLKLNGGIAVLAQEQTRLQAILKLLAFN